MPYKISKNKDQYCVHNSDTGEKKGCSDTREKAIDHMKALYAAESQAAIAQSMFEEAMADMEFFDDEVSTPLVKDETFDDLAVELQTKPGIEEYRWEGPIVFEGVLTGDNRIFKKDSLTWDENTLPWPFRWQRGSIRGHDGAVPIGRVDKLERKPDGSVYGYGVIIPSLNDEAAEYLRMLEAGVASGVSVDGDSAEFDVQELGEGKSKAEFSKMRLRSLTAVDIPAFNEARVSLAEKEDDPEEVVAEKRKKRVSWAYNLTASAIPVVPPVEWFADPALEGPTPITVTPEGQVYGHLALFDTCHIGLPGCVTPPKGSSYKYFHTGEVETAEGDCVEVGHLTFDTGHASMSATAKQAAEHYDHTGAVAADVRAGEDQYGIWVAGALRSTLSDEDIRCFRAAPLSGDWRRIAGRLELVGALAVNVPGFPVPRAKVLVASGQTETLLTFADDDETGKPVVPKNVTAEQIEEKGKNLTPEEMKKGLKDLGEILADPTIDLEGEERKLFEEIYSQGTKYLQDKGSLSEDELEEFHLTGQHNQKDHSHGGGGGGGGGSAPAMKPASGLKKAASAAKDAGEKYTDSFGTKVKQVKTAEEAHKLAKNHARAAFGLLFAGSVGVGLVAAGAFTLGGAVAVGGISVVALAVGMNQANKSNAYHEQAQDLTGLSASGLDTFTQNEDVMAELDAYEARLRTVKKIEFASMAAEDEWEFAEFLMSIQDEEAIQEFFNKCHAQNGRFCGGGGGGGGGGGKKTGPGSSAPNPVSYVKQRAKTAVSTARGRSESEDVKRVTTGGIRRALGFSTAYGSVKVNRLANTDLSKISDKDLGTIKKQLTSDQRRYNVMHTVGWASLSPIAIGLSNWKTKRIPGQIERIDKELGGRGSKLSLAEEFLSNVAHEFAAAADTGMSLAEEIAQAKKDIAAGKGPKNLGKPSPKDMAEIKKMVDALEPDEEEGITADMIKQMKKSFAGSGSDAETSLDYGTRLRLEKKQSLANRIPF